MGLLDFFLNKTFLDFRIFDKSVKFNYGFYQCMLDEVNCAQLETVTEEILADFEFKTEAKSEKISDKSEALKLILIFKIIATFSSTVGRVDEEVMTEYVEMNFVPFVKKALKMPMIYEYIRLFVRLLT